MKFFQLFLIMLIFIKIFAGLSFSKISDDDIEKIHFVSSLLTSINNHDAITNNLKTVNLVTHNGVLHCSDFKKNYLYKINAANKSDSYFLFTTINNDNILSSSINNDPTDDKNQLIIDSIINSVDNDNIIPIMKKQYSKIKDPYGELLYKGGALSVLNTLEKFSKAKLDKENIESIFDKTYSFIVYNNEMYNLFACEEFEDQMNFFNVVLWGIHEGTHNYYETTPFFIYSKPKKDKIRENNLLITTEDDYSKFIRFFSGTSEFLKFFSYTILNGFVTCCVTNSPGLDPFINDLLSRPLIKYSDLNFNKEKNDFFKYLLKNSSELKIDFGSSFASPNHTDIDYDISTTHDNTKIKKISFNHSLDHTITCESLYQNTLYSFDNKNYFFFTKFLQYNYKKIDPSLQHISTDTEYIKFHSFESLEQSMINHITPIQSFNHNDNSKLYFSSKARSIRSNVEMFEGKNLGLNIFYYTYSFIIHNGKFYNLVACENTDDDSQVILWGYVVKKDISEFTPFYLEKNLSFLDRNDIIRIMDEANLFKSKYSIHN